MVVVEGWNVLHLVKRGGDCPGGGHKLQQVFEVQSFGLDIVRRECVRGGNVRIPGDPAKLSYTTADD